MAARQARLGAGGKSRYQRQHQQRGIAEKAYPWRGAG